MVAAVSERSTVEFSDRATKSQKPNGMGAADERLQGTGRGSCEV